MLLIYCPREKFNDTELEIVSVIVPAWACHGGRYRAGKDAMRDSFGDALRPDKTAAAA